MIRSKYFIEVFSSLYGCEGHSKMYMPLPKCEIDMEKALKKWYKRLCKAAMNYEHIDVYAGVECEDGSFSDLSISWAYKEMEHDPSILFC